MHGRTTVEAVLVLAMLGTSLAETGRAQEPPGATVASALTEGARVRASARVVRLSVASLWFSVG